MGIDPKVKEEEEEGEEMKGEEEEGDIRNVGIDPKVKEEVGVEKEEEKRGG